jgi:hypothetical protein
MKKITTIALLFIGSLLIMSILACKSAKEKELDKLQSNLKTYFISNDIDSSITVDSFRLFKIDTIKQVGWLSDQGDALYYQKNKLQKLFESNNEIVNADINEIRLYKIMGSKELAAMSGKEATSQNNKGVLIMKEMDTLGRILIGISEKIKTADSVKPVAFQAICLYQIRQKDKSVKRDTCYIFLNTNRDIIDRSDYLKLPYKVNYIKL